MKQTMKYWIPITPRPQERPRFYHGSVMTAPRTRDYQEAIKSYFRSKWGRNNILAENKNIGIEMEIWFYLLKPKRRPKKLLRAIYKPDLSNLIKAIEDSLDFGENRVIENDSRICDIYAHKREVDSLDKCGILIVLREVDATKEDND